MPADAPLLLVANELLDCLPARQFQRTASGWAERVVGLDDAGDLAFGLRPAPLRPGEAPVGTVIELSPAQEGFASELADRLARQRGCGAADRLWTRRARLRRHPAGAGRAP
ncbi:MAG: SAM-dependent methyltransferase [Caulobacteraceae bacterium]